MLSESGWRNLKDLEALMTLGTLTPLIPSFFQAEPGLRARYPGRGYQAAYRDCVVAIETVNPKFADLSTLCVWTFFPKNGE